MDYIQKQKRKVLIINIIFSVVLFSLLGTMGYLFSTVKDGMIDGIIFPITLMFFIAMYSFLQISSYGDNHKIIKSFKVDDEDFICIFNKNNNRFYITKSLISGNDKKIGKFDKDAFIKSCIDNNMENDQITEEFIYKEIEKRAGEEIGKFTVEYLQKTVKENKVEDIIQKL